MKVLYFIPKTQGGNLPFFTKEFFDRIAGMAEAHVMTPRNGDAPQTGSSAVVHRLSAYRMMIGRNKKRFSRIVGEVGPDIIHIIGSWDITAYYIYRWAETYRIPVVLSPLKGLAPWNVLRSYWLRRLPQLLLYQKSLLSGTHGVHAVGRQEQSFILDAALHPSLHPRKPWNSRIAVIEDPVLTDAIDVAGAAAAMMRLYAKVLDSNPFMRMTEEEVTAESALLRVGMSQDSISADIPRETRQRLMQMSDAAWRRILLHATDEGIADMVTRGALAMQLKRKSIVIESTGRFENTRHSDKRRPADIPATAKGRKAERLAGRYGGDDAAVRICKMIVNVAQMMKSGTLSRRHLADLYAAVRFGNCNERALRLMLRRLRMSKTAARLMQIMGETLWLEPGFMPLEPLDDKGTDDIRKTLFNLKIQ